MKIMEVQMGYSETVRRLMEKSGLTHDEAEHVAYWLVSDHRDHGRAVDLLKLYGERKAGKRA